MRFDADTATAPDVLAEAARAAGLKAEPADGLEAALARALADAGPVPPRIVICGSLYLAGEVLALSPETWPT